MTEEKKTKEWWEWLEEADIRVMINVDNAIKAGDFTLAEVEP